MSENSPLHRAQPWRIREEPDCFIIEDAIGFPIGRVFFADDRHEGPPTGQMSRDQAWQIADRAVAVQAAKAALRAVEKTLTADTDGRTRRPVPRILN